MKKVRKISAILLLVVIVFNTLSVFSAEEQQHVSMTDVQISMLERLNAFGVIDTQASEFEAQKEISRTNFANIVVNIIYPDIDNYSNTLSGDLRESDKGMLFLRDIGVVRGNGNEIYEPDRVITVGEAVKILSCTLGYSVMVKSGSIEEYMTLGVKLGILNSVNPVSTVNLTNIDMAYMLDNAMDVKVMTTDTEAAEIGERTMLENYLHIYKSRGVLTNIGDVDLYGGGLRLRENEVRIGGNVYIAKDMDISHYIGMNLTFYYKAERDDKNVLVYVDVNTDDVVEISSENIVSYSGGTYTYYTENDKSKTISVSDDTIYVYNGRYTDEMPNFIPKYGSIKFINNDNDGKYEVLNIIDKKLTIVKSVLQNELVIFDEYRPAYDIKLDPANCDSYEIYDQNGVKKSIADITTGMVLEVEKSASDNTYVKITIVSSLITGTVTKISGEKVYIDGHEYKKSDRFEELEKAGELKNDFGLGKTAIFYLNGKDQLVSATKVISEDYRLGVVMAFKAQINAFEADPQIKIYDQSGVAEIFTFNKTVRINGSPIKRENFEDGDIPVGKLIKYKSNINGAITELYLPASDSNELKEVCSGDLYYKRTLIGYVLGKVESDRLVGCYVNRDAKIFVVMGGNLSDEKNYQVLESTTLMTNTTHTAYGYNTEGKLGQLDAVLIKKDTNYGFALETSRKVGLINSFGDILCPDGEVRKVIKALVEGSETEIIIDDKRTNSNAPLPFKEGDIIYYSLSANGYFTLSDANINPGTDTTANYNMLLSYSEDGNHTITTKGWRFKQTAFDQDGLVRYGAVYDTAADGIYINCKNDVINEPEKVEFLNVQETGTHVYVYDTKKKEYRTGDVSEAYGYKNNTTKYSTAYTFINFVCAEIVIFQ